MIFTEVGSIHGGGDVHSNPDSESAFRVWNLAPQEYEEGVRSTLPQLAVSYSYGRAFV